MTKKFLLIFCSLLFIHCSNQKNNDFKFDSQKWLKSDGGALLDDIRLNMTNDLIESKILVNKSRNEIEKIIGYSSKLSVFNDPNIVYYPVKEVYKFDIDPDYMIFLEIIYKKDISQEIKLVKKK